MNRQFTVLSILSAIALAACGKGGAAESMDDAMRRDLEAVQAGTIELAPSGRGQKVVSAIEQTRRAETRPTAPKPKAPPVASQVAQNSEPEPTPDPVIAAPVSTEPAAARPTNTPMVSPPPPGGYKTVGEVIRKAPFPIKPATTVKPPV